MFGLTSAEVPNTAVHTAMPVAGLLAHEFELPVLNLLLGEGDATGSIETSELPPPSELSVEFGTKTLTELPLTATPSAFEVVAVAANEVPTAEAPNRSPTAITWTILSNRFTFKFFRPRTGLVYAAVWLRGL